MMKKISEILVISGGPKRKTEIDSQSIFYFFKKVIETEFGRKGLQNLQPDYWKNGVLFIKSQNPLWGGELWINKNEIIKKINKDLGCEEVLEIKVN